MVGLCVLHGLERANRPDASETSETYVDGGNFTTNRAAGNGGFLYAAGGAVVTIMGGNVSNNVAERRAGAVSNHGM